MCSHLIIFLKFDVKSADALSLELEAAVAQGIVGVFQAWSLGAQLLQHDDMPFVQEAADLHCFVRSCREHKVDARVHLVTLNPNLDSTALFMLDVEDNSIAPS